jgi:hypothetical protein
MGRPLDTAQCPFIHAVVCYAFNDRCIDRLAHCLAGPTVAEQTGTARLAAGRAQHAGSEGRGSDLSRGELGYFRA